MILARTPEAPWGLIIILAAILAGCLLDRLPMRSFYSRRAFEPPRPRTYTELECELRQFQEDGTISHGELHRPSHGELERPPGRELERW